MDFDEVYSGASPLSTPLLSFHFQQKPFWKKTNIHNKNKKLNTVIKLCFHSIYVDLDEAAIHLYVRWKWTAFFIWRSILSSLGEAFMNSTKLHRAKNTKKLIINNKYIKYLHSFIIFISNLFLVTPYHLHNSIIILISIFKFLCLTPYLFTNYIRPWFMFLLEFLPNSISFYLYLKVT